MATRVLFVPAGMIGPTDKLSPSDTLLRCHEALALWRTGEYDLLLCTGGLFLPRSTQTVPAAELMRDWFVELQIPLSRIVVEVASLDTYENVRYGIEVLDREVFAEHYCFDGDFKYTIVSHWTHANRIALILRRTHGIRANRHNMFYALSWKGWLVELISTIDILWDRRGNSRLSRWNREQRRKAAAS